VIGVARHARDDAQPVSALPELLPQADVVVDLLPLAPETEKFVDSAFLARMKPGALFVNAGRGKTVDTDALLEALRSGRIRAALDVTDPEPLPSDHPLWHAPNILITPHIEAIGSRANRSAATPRGSRSSESRRGISQLARGLEVVVSKTGKEILESSTVIAVVGASRDSNKAGGSVPVGLQKRGFRVIPINPYADTLFGERVYRSLADVPEKIDLVDVFRPAADAPEIARQAVAVGAKALWLQLEIRSNEARRIAEAAGLDYVEDECTAVTSSLYRIKKVAAA